MRMACHSVLATSSGIRLSLTDVSSAGVNITQV